jgi:4-phytase/acid phosphatase/peptide/nickel transport system substrate-binding protein
VFRLPLLIFCILSGIPACESKKATSELPASKSGGVLYFGIETDFAGFDVLKTVSGGVLIPSMATVAGMIMEPLFRFDQAGNRIPVLGLSAQRSAKGDFWDIQLRKGVLFHDGSAFNADAVVHHWNRILDPDNQYRGRKLFEPIQSVEKVDIHTVRFLMKYPWPAFLKVISDELYLGAYIPSPKAVTAGTHDNKPVGTGPFRYGDWNGADYYIVRKNEHYWDKGKPFLEKIVLRSIPDHQTRYASLLSGQTDMIVLDRGHMIERAKKDPALYVHASEGNGAEIILINHRRPPFNDIRVRRALALANSQKLHIKLVYGNTIPFVTHPFGTQLKCEADGYWKHDSKKAAQLLAEYSKPLKIELIHTPTSRGRAIGALMQQLYGKIGVALRPVPLSTAPHVMNVMKKDYDLATWRILGSKDMGAQLYRSFHSNSPTNYSGYQNPVMDDLLEAQQKELDPLKRDALWCRIIRRMNEDAVILYRGGRRRHLVSRKKIKDITDVSGIRINLSTAWLDETVKGNFSAWVGEKIQMNFPEKKTPDPFDCREPGNTAAVKAKLIGRWKGTDSLKGALELTFHGDNTVVGSQSMGYDLSGEYRICKEKVIWKAATGAIVIVFFSEKTLQGTFELDTYRGTLRLEKTGT